MGSVPDYQIGFPCAGCTNLHTHKTWIYLFNGLDHILVFLNDPTHFCFVG